MLDLDRFEALSFDCYGTLIDWETGLEESLAPVLAGHGVDVPAESLLEMYAGLETEAERGPYRAYAEVLRSVLEGLGRRLGFTPDAGELDRFARSVGDWPAFPDSARALGALKRRFRLAVISNIDDELFALSARRLGVEFDWVVTAQQARSYKPAHRNFKLALERMGLPRDRVLHVAQSLYHDIAPARALGWSTVWVNRRRGQSGFGATPAALGRPDLEVPDLESLARRADLL